MKKAISAILIFIIIQGLYISSLAYEYAPDIYSLDFSYLKESSGAEIIDAEISFQSGGYAVFNDELRFSAASVTVTAKYPRGSIQIICGEQTLLLSFDNGEIQTAEFEYGVHKQTSEITVRAISEVTLTDISFHRVDLDFPLEKQLAMVNMPTEEYLTQSAAVMKIDGNAYYTNGAVRYVDCENPKARVRLIDGKMYAPAHAIADALHLYREIIPEKAYVLLRKDNDTEVLISSDTCYYTRFTAEKINIDNPSVYIDGTAYLPIRLIGEIFGETVLYSKGYVVLDTYKRAHEIIKNKTLSDFVRSKIDNFSAEYTGKVYHVSQDVSASDDNSGALEAPFRTLTKACEIVKPGDTVYIHEGVYREVLRPKVSGSDEAPIVFKAAEGEKVIVSALEQLNSFALYHDEKMAGENIAIAMMPSTLQQGRNQIFYKGKALGEGRHPNVDSVERCSGLSLSDLWPTFGDIVIRDYTEEENALETKPVIYDLVSSSDLDQSDNFWAGGTYVGLQGSGWSMSTGVIASSKKGSITVDDSKATSTWWFGKNKPGDFGYITNHIHTVDMPGEWYVDTDEKILYICLPKNESADSLKLEYKARQLVFDLRQRSNIIIEGIETVGGGVTTHGGNMNVINKCNMSYISHYTFSDDQRDGFIDNKNLRTSDAAPARGEVGIYFDGDSNVISNCIIDHSAGAGIYSAGAYTLIENNYITDCGYMGSYVSGIVTEGPGWETDKDYRRGGEYIYSNTVKRAGRACFSVASVVDNLANYTTALPIDVCYNDFSDALICARDGAVVYEHGTNMGNDILRGKFHHNSLCNQWEADIGNGLPRAGMYHDNCLVYQETYDNMIYYNNNTGMSSRVYTQNKLSFPTAYSVTYEWGNTRFDDADHLFLSDISYSDYPGGRAFKIGSDLHDGKFLYNYENRKAENEWYSPIVSTESENCYVFENVDFKTDCNMLSLYYSGDKYDNGETVEIIIGNSIATGEKLNTEIYSSATELTYSEGIEIPVGIFSGTQNVYIRYGDYKSFKANRIRPYRDASKPAVIKKLYGGKSDELTPVKNHEEPILKYFSYDPRHPYINNTWNGTVLRYNDVEINSNFNALVWSAASGDRWTGNTVTVYFDDLNSEPVGQFTIDKTDWNDFTQEKVSLGKTVAGGTHDVYIVFGGENKSSDWYYLGFASE